MCSIQTMNENICIKLIDFLKDLLSNEYGLGADFEEIFYKETITNVINILSAIMTTDSENILEHLSDFFISLSLKERLTNSEDILKWLEMILPYIQIPSFFKLLQHLKLPITPTIARVILELTPAHDYELVCNMFSYLMGIFPQTNEFWSIFPIDFILNFFNSAQFQIRDSLLTFFSVSLSTSDAYEFVPHVIQAILLNFTSPDLFNKTNQKTAINLFKSMKKDKRKQDCIIRLLSEIYPNETDAGSTFVELFTTRENPSEVTLTKSLMRHIQLNTAACA